jgi:hypothetical protein
MEDVLYTSLSNLRFFQLPHFPILLRGMTYEGRRVDDIVPGLARIENLVLFYFIFFI